MPFAVTISYVTEGIHTHIYANVYVYHRDRGDSLFKIGNRPGTAIITVPSVSNRTKSDGEDREVKDTSLLITAR